MAHKFNQPLQTKPTPHNMNNQTKSFHCIAGVNTPDRIEDSSHAQLAFLALFGSYGEQLVAKRLLEAIAKDEPAEPVVLAFPKGRWTV